MERAEADAVSDGVLSVSHEDAQSELDRVLSDPAFQCSERNKKFLRYISEEFLGGRQDRLKGYSIGTDVFGRPEDFNPSSDGIVRIEATRLRAALIRYYETQEAPQGVEIRLPKGRYVPEFVSIPQLRRTDQPTTDRSERTALPRFIDRLRHRLTVPTTVSQKAILASGILVVVVALLGVFTVQNRDLKVTDRPTVSVDLMLRGGPDDTRALAVRDSLMIALSGFNTLRLSADAYTASTGGRGRPDGRMRSRYQILLKYASDMRSRSMWWQVIDRHSGEAIRAGEERVSVGDRSPFEAEEQLVSRLALRLASFQGVINSVETARELEAPSLGNGCILRAGLARSTRSPELLQNAQSCLQRTLKFRPYDADAHAMLALVLLASDRDRRLSTFADLARDHANQAVALAPQSDRSHMAQMMVAFRTGRLEEARQAGRRAMALNPHNSAVTAKYSSILFAMGHWQEAAQLAERASLVDDIQQPDAERTLAFDAYRRGAYDEAVARLRRMPNDDCLVTQLLLTASLAKAGDEKEAVTAFAAIKGERPGLAQTLRLDMERRQLSPVLIEALQAGLNLAGQK